MNPRLAVIVSAFLATPAAAQVPQGNASPPPPKPTLAQAQNVVQIISGDKVKAKAYCDLSRLNYQIAAAQTAKNQKTVVELSKQADVLEQKLGPEYDELMNSLQQVDPRSKEGKIFVETLQPLEKMCSSH